MHIWQKTTRFILLQMNSQKWLGVSVGHAYKLIRKLNQELEKEGFLVIAGKVPRRYFEKRWYGFSA